MEYPTHPTQPGQETRTSNRLKYTFDGHFLPATPPDDGTSDTAESNQSNSETRESSKPGHTDGNQTTSLAASIRVIANTMLRMELAELEMMKKREIARLEAQKRQAELEDEMTRIMLQMQLQIASFLSQKRASRKRKSSGINDDYSSTSNMR